MSTTNIKNFTKEQIYEYLQSLLKQCKELNRIPYKKEFEMKTIPMIANTLNRYIKIYYSDLYSDYIDFCHKYNYQGYGEIFVKDHYKKIEDINIEDI